jgi:outer membrane PBP1 activator LpoA protein
MGKEILEPPGLEIEKEIRKKEIFDLDKEVTVKRTSGKIEEGWAIVEKNKNRLRVEKEENKKTLSKWVTKENLIDWKIAGLEEQKERIEAWADLTPEDRNLIEKINGEIKKWERIKEIK